MVKARDIPTTHLLIFDLDGTLVNSNVQILDSLNFTLRSLSYPTLNAKDFDEKFGLPIENILDHLKLKPNELTGVIDNFRENLAKKIRAGNDLYEGVEIFLSRAQNLGFKIAIATSKPSHLANLVVSNSVLTNYIDFTQGTDGFPAKPAPHVILKCLDYFNTSKAVMFGDRVEDIKAASQVALPSIGLAQGSHSPELLSSAGAVRVYKNFMELFLDSRMLFEMMNRFFD